VGGQACRAGPARAFLLVVEVSLDTMLSKIKVGACCDYYHPHRRNLLMERPRSAEEMDLIAALSAEERTFLYQHALLKKYRKNQLIHSPGDKIQMVGYVKSGRVKVYNLAASGKEIIYRFCTPNSFFGIAEIFGEEKRSVYVEAMEPTEVLCINKRNFEELLRHNPNLALIVMQILGRRIRQAHKAIKDFVTADVRSRLAQLLLKLAQMGGAGGDRDPISIADRFTHQEMADMVGANRQTVTEIINDFKRQGYIRYDGGKITIIDRQGLAALLND
jgi:CRP-like cAMP-binding protein